jgi:hypothetical protein
MRTINSRRVDVQLGLIVPRVDNIASHERLGWLDVGRLVAKHVSGSAKDSTDDDQQGVECWISLGESVESGSGLADLASGHFVGLKLKTSASNYQNLSEADAHWAWEGEMPL